MCVCAAHTTWWCGVYTMCVIASFVCSILPIPRSGPHIVHCVKKPEPTETYTTQPDRDGFLFGVRVLDGHVAHAELAVEGLDAVDGGKGDEDNDGEDPVLTVGQKQGLCPRLQAH